ncbi:MAG: HupE/UreJ family protein [Gemmatimonadetes bacterium]|nr:HupE/UreJ family protein [Gemmatimonadota bacterium]
MFIGYRRSAALLVGLTLLLPTWSGEAHEIPADVTVQVFVKPDAETLRMIVRVPLISMRDYDFPAREPGYLIISEAEPLIQEAAVEWIANYVQMYEGNELLARPVLAAARIAIPGDRAFRSYDDAIENALSAPLPDDIDLPPQQAMLDVVLEWTITSEESDFSIDPLFAQLGIRTVTVLRFLPAGGTERAFQYSGNPGLVRLDPRWHQAAWRFVVLGFDHILDGIDHLLFLFCLVVPFRSFRALVPIITSFTAGHSITLIAAALGLTPQALWFPPLIETLIALSIVYMAFENILGAKLKNRWMIAFSFGLVHGFGFSFALSEVLQFGGSHLLTSLVSFNVGVEFGQLFVLALTVPLLEFLFRKVLPEVGGIVVLSALLAHTGWHWMTERGGQLIQYDFRAPIVGAGFTATALRWLMLVLIIFGTGWLLRLGFERLTADTAGQEEI